MQQALTEFDPDIQNDLKSTFKSSQPFRKFLRILLVFVKRNLKHT